MANISWTSSSISNYFNTSLGTSANSAFSGIYNSLSDAALIKCGAYGKLMTSYYANVKNASDTSSETSTDSTSTSESKSDAKIKNTVLDELLSNETKTSKVSNNVLDELLTSSKTDSTACTYDSTGTKTQTTTSTIDQSI